jgi:hypothetical protein
LDSRTFFLQLPDNNKPTNHQQNGPLIVSIPLSIHRNSANLSSVPTQNDIAVPESVLKKQKAHQKTTDSQAADLKKKREV